MNSTKVAIDISGPLKVKPKDIVKYLSVKIGDDVEEHGLIAHKKSLFGGIEIKSPVAGTVVNIETEHGTIVIDSKQEDIDLGVKKETKPEESVDQDEPVDVEDTSEDENPKDEPKEVERDDSDDEEIEEDVPEELKEEGKKPPKKKFSRAVTKHKIKGVTGFGVGKGEGLYVEDLRGFAVTAEHAGLIILAEELPTTLMLYKASAIGVEAFLLKDVKRDEIDDLKKEFEGKAQIAVMMVSKDMDLKKLDGVELEIKEGYVVVAV